MKNPVVAFAVGLVFALGLGLAGMTQPARVIGFLDLFGRWDPTLLFVMLGAIPVYFVCYRLRRPSPLFASSYDLPAPGRIDGRLIAGAALFGIGWGLAGFCPGPALVSLVTLLPAVLLFVGAMLIGLFFGKFR